MAQQAEIRKRIKSVNDIRQMTRAMQLISAVKMRRARSQLARTLPFFALCARSIVELGEAGVTLDNHFFQLQTKLKGDTWRIGYFIMTGDQGLAGAYNANILQKATDYIGLKEADNEKKGLLTENRLFICGSSGKEQLVRQGFSVDESFFFPVSEPTFYRARDISDYIYDLYDSGELDLIYFIYTRIRSAVQLELTVTRILPVNPAGLAELVPPEFDLQHGFIDGAAVEFTPSPEAVAATLSSTYLNGMVYGILAEAYASEQTARMLAMDQATENAGLLQEQLTLAGNKARQSAITAELAEIVGGAELLAARQAEPSRKESL